MVSQDHSFNCFNTYIVLVSHNILLKDLEFFLDKANCKTNIEEADILTISSYNITDHNNFRINSFME